MDRDVIDDLRGTYPEVVENAKAITKALRKRVRRIVANLGDIEWCPHCQKFSCYAYCYSDEATGLTLGLTNIGCTDMGGFECPHCKTRWMRHDSPLNAACYTHSED